MHQYGEERTRQALAEIAVSTRKWAQLNPKAWKRDPLTVAELSGNPPPTRFKPRDPDTESPNIEVSPPSTSLREAET